ncbi:MAG: type I restriction endonuclease subunit R, partial [Lachnospiraceae bacterium]|nr:type I restriction endonuclease subunit R [Lachnospiraceae bacterium]
RELARLISQEHLKEPETRRVVENAFRDGEVRTAGTDIDKLMPPVSRFGGGRAKKKQTVIDKLKAFFERFFGIGGAFKVEQDGVIYKFDTANQLQMVAEPPIEYGKKESFTD